MLSLLTNIITALPAMIDAGITVSNIINDVETVISENRVPNDAEWDALDAAVKQQKARFEAAATD